MDRVYWNPGETLGEVEKKVIIGAMSYYAFDRNMVSQSLGISRRTLDTRIGELRLESLETDHKKEQERKITAGLEATRNKSLAVMEAEEEERLKKKEAEANAKNKNSPAGRNR